MITIPIGRQPTRLGVIALTSLLLTACGGGGGGGEITAPPPPPPPPTTFSIGGTASGVAGSGLTLQNNGADSLAIAADGNFTFATEINSGASYDVTVTTQPVSPTQTCTVANGSGTATADVTNVTVTCTTASAVDTDMDGITDADEQNIYGTNWEDPDTDGDGYSDGDEVQTFDPSVNNFRFNPLVADVPEIRIEIQETPEIGANITEENSSTETVTTTRAQSTSNTSSTTFGASTTLGVEASQSATAGASLAGPKAEVETQVKVTAEATVSFDATNSQENREAWERMLANNIETTTTASDGFIGVGVNIVNSGHLSLRIEALDLVAVRVNDGDKPFSAVGTLARDTAFTAIDLEAGESINNLRFERTSISLPTIRSLLTDTRSLKLEQGNVTIIDTSDESVALQAQDINRRTAKLVIDYGPYAATEFYRASTNVVPDEPGRSLAALLNDILRIPYDEDSTGLATVRNLSSSTGRWVVTHKRIGDTDTQITTFDPERESYSLDDIDVRAFDEVLLVLLEDPDNDGLGYREELLHGTDPLSADTDGDGRSDFEEVRESWRVNAVNVQDPKRYADAEVTSSPLIADYDNDGLSDREEFAELLDPYNADTDGDGELDGSDRNNGGEPLFAVLPLLLGEDPNTPSTPFDVATTGTISAEAPRVVATASIDWDSDGIAEQTFETAPGGQSQRTIPLIRNTYPGPGDYQISLDASDDDSPANQLNETAMVRLTAPENPVPDGLGYNGGYRIGIHLRTAVDLNQDRYDDILVISNSTTLVSLGSADGLQPFSTWSTGNWIPSIYEGLKTDPRLFADIDNDGDLDIVGVDASEGTVSYGLNNGAGFDDPVTWLSGLNWNASRDQAFLADINGDRLIDFVHASAADQAVTTYTSNSTQLTMLSRFDGTTFDARYPDRTRFPIWVTDLNNDGCADIVLFGQSDTFTNQSQCNGSFGAYINQFRGFGFDQGYRVGREKRWVHDTTGDELPDLVAAAGAVVVQYVNTSTTQEISFSVNRQTLTDDFVTDDGWADNRDIEGRRGFGVFPRYLADVDADGLVDLVGFGAAGTAVGINELGAEGTRVFTDQRILARGFDVVSTTDWYRDYTLPTPPSPFPSPGPGANPCGPTFICRDYGPRIVGDINGDGRADLIGFSNARLVYQQMPYVTQFE
ncbi:MAG: hypothetical protein AAFO81_00825 [Pseudomonadota bacterium]